MLARSGHRIAAAALGALLLRAAPTAGATIVVGPADGSCPGAIFSRIQSALDAAVPRTTVFVCAGLYAEQLVVTKRVRLVAAPGARLVPDGLPVLTPSLRSGRPVAAALVVRAPAVVQGLAVDAGANGLAACDGSEPLLAGVYVRGVPAQLVGTSVEGARIADAPPGCANGVGVLVQGGGSAPRVRVEGNSIATYQRAGIVVQDGAQARVRQNLVVGAGDTPDHAQAGIEIGPGVRARVEENVVRAHAGPSGATCELDAAVVAAGARARIQGNLLEANSVGIRADARGHRIRANVIDGGAAGLIGLRLDADESRVTANTVAGHAAAGILLAGNRSRLGANAVSAVREAAGCDAARAAAPACAALLSRCGVGVWILGRANQVAATAIHDADTPVVDDGRGNVVR